MPKESDPVTPTTGVLAVELLALVGELEDDELRVVVSVARGLRKGRAVYGPLRIAADARNYGHEAYEEARDLAVYLTAQLLRLQDAHRPTRPSPAPSKAPDTIPDPPHVEVPATFDPVPWWDPSNRFQGVL
jgi:hypothetical protein